MIVSKKIVPRIMRLNKQIIDHSFYEKIRNKYFTSVENRLAGLSLFYKKEDQKNASDQIVAATSIHRHLYFIENYFFHKFFSQNMKLAGKEHHHWLQIRNHYEFDSEDRTNTLIRTKKSEERIQILHSEKDFFSTIVQKIDWFLKNIPMKQRNDEITSGNLSNRYFNNYYAQNQRVDQKSSLRFLFHFNRDHYEPNIGFTNSFNVSNFFHKPSSSNKDIRYQHINKNLTFLTNSLEQAIFQIWQKSNIAQHIENNSVSPTNRRMQFVDIQQKNDHSPFYINTHQLNTIIAGLSEKINRKFHEIQITTRDQDINVYQKNWFFSEKNSVYNRFLSEDSIYVNRFMNQNNISVNRDLAIVQKKLQQYDPKQFFTFVRFDLYHNQEVKEKNSLQYLQNSNQENLLEVSFFPLIHSLINEKSKLANHLTTIYKKLQIFNNKKEKSDQYNYWIGSGDRAKVANLVPQDIFKNFWNEQKLFELQAFFYQLPLTNARRFSFNIHDVKKMNIVNDFLHVVTNQEDSFFSKNQLKTVNNKLINIITKNNLDSFLSNMTHNLSQWLVKNQSNDVNFYIKQIQLANRMSRLNRTEVKNQQNENVFDLANYYINQLQLPNMVHHLNRSIEKNQKVENAFILANDYIKQWQQATITHLVSRANENQKRNILHEIANDYIKQLQQANLTRHYNQSEVNNEKKTIFDVANDYIKQLQLAIVTRHFNRSEVKNEKRSIFNVTSDYIKQLQLSNITYPINRVGAKTEKKTIFDVANEYIKQLQLVNITHRFNRTELKNEKPTIFDVTNNYINQLQQANFIHRFNQAEERTEKPAIFNVSNEFIKQLQLAKITKYFNRSELKNQMNENVVEIARFYPLLEQGLATINTLIPGEHRVRTNTPLNVFNHLYHLLQMKNIQQEHSIRFSDQLLHIFMEQMKQQENKNWSFIQNRPLANTMQITQRLVNVVKNSFLSRNRDEQLVNNAKTVESNFNNMTHQHFSTKSNPNRSLIEQITQLLTAKFMMIKNELVQHMYSQNLSNMTSIFPTFSQMGATSDRKHNLAKTAGSLQFKSNVAPNLIQVDKGKSEVKNGIEQNLPLIVVSKNSQKTNDFVSFHDFIEIAKNIVHRKAFSKTLSNDRFLKKAIANTMSIVTLLEKRELSDQVHINQQSRSENLINKESHKNIEYLFLSHKSLLNARKMSKVEQAFTEQTFKKSVIANVTVDLYKRTQTEREQIFNKNYKTLVSSFAHKHQSPNQVDNAKVQKVNKSTFLDRENSYKPVAIEYLKRSNQQETKPTIKAKRVAKDLVTTMKQKNVNSQSSDIPLNDQNFNEIVEKIYKAIERKMSLERKRRGLS